MKTHLKICSFLVLFSVQILADDSLLSTLKKEEIALDRKNALLNAQKLKNDWIMPVKLSYSKSSTNYTGTYLKSETSQISLSQPIFRSGGIYYAIQYADATKDYSSVSVDIKEKELISNVMSILYNIRKIDYQILKQNLLLDNSNIEVLKKEELFKDGLLDSSELDNAILARNTNQIALYNLEEQKDELLKNLKNLSDVEYDNVKLKNLKTPTLQEYMDNLKIIQQKADIKQKEYLKNMTVADQLVTVSLDVRYSKNYADASIPSYPDSNNYYGATISMPIFDINAFKKIEIKKLELLQSKLALSQIQRELEKFYNSTINKISILDNKIDVSIKDYELYVSLLNDIKDKYNVGLVTKYDVDTLNNSKKIKEFDKNIYMIDKQILLIDLYSNMKVNL